MYDWLSNFFNECINYLSSPFTLFTTYTPVYKRRLIAYRRDSRNVDKSVEKEQVMCDFIQEPHSIIQYDQKYRNDKQFIIEASEENPLCLSYTEVDIPDKQFILDQCKTNSSAWRHYTYRNTDVEFWVEMLKIDPSFYTDIPETIRKNKAFDSVELSEIPTQYKLYYEYV